MKVIDTDRIHAAILMLAKRMGSEMQDDIEDTIRYNDSVASGVLAKSVTRDVTKLPTGVKIEVGPTASYGLYVETGTRPHWPPRQAIADWLMEKTGGGFDERELRSAAFLVSRKIARDGTAPRPYIEPVWQRHAHTAAERFANAVLKSA